MKRLSISHQKTNSRDPDADDHLALTGRGSISHDRRRSTLPDAGRGGGRNQIAVLQNVPDQWDVEDMDQDHPSPRSRYKSGSLRGSKTNNSNTHGLTSNSDYYSNLQGRRSSEVRFRSTIVNEGGYGDDDDDYSVSNRQYQKPHRHTMNHMTQSLTVPHQPHSQMQVKRRATATGASTYDAPPRKDILSSSASNALNNLRPSTSSGLQRKRSSFANFKLIPRSSSFRKENDPSAAGTLDNGPVNNGVIDNEFLSLMPGVQNDMQMSKRAQDDANHDGGDKTTRRFRIRRASHSSSSSGGDAGGTRTRRKRWGTNTESSASSDGHSHPSRPSNEDASNTSKSLESSRVSSKFQDLSDISFGSRRPAEEKVPESSQNIDIHTTAHYTPYGLDIPAIPAKNKPNYHDSMNTLAPVIILDTSGHTYTTVNTRHSVGTHDNTEKPVLPDDMSRTTSLASVLDGQDRSLYTTCPPQLADMPTLDLASSQMHDMCTEFMSYQHQKEAVEIPHSFSQRSGGFSSEDGESNTVQSSNQPSGDPILPKYDSFPKDVLQIIRLMPGNDHCIDCGAASANHNGSPFMWVCSSYGTLLCDACAMRHTTKAEVYESKRLPVLTKVKSLKYGRWTFMEILALLEGGNQQMLDYFQLHERTSVRRTSSDFQRPDQANLNCLLPGDVVNKNKEFDMKYKSKVAVSYRRMLAERVLIVIESNDASYEHDDEIQMPSVSGRGSGRKLGGSFVG